MKAHGAGGVGAKREILDVLEMWVKEAVYILRDLDLGGGRRMRERVEH
jgi:hypothetical protein